MNLAYFFLCLQDLVVHRLSNHMQESMTTPAVILDTNVFIAAAFNKHSHSANIIEAVRQRQLRMLWNQQTRTETEYLLQKIPRLSWHLFSNLFQEENCYQGETNPQQFSFVDDAEDRKFAALSAVTGATLITQDRDLLCVRQLLCVPVLTPKEFIEQQF